MPASSPADPNAPPAGSARAEDTVVPAGVDSYEGALAELERLVSQMEGGQMPLDQLLHGYRRGAELLAYCRARLQAVESQVKVLEDGQLRDWTGP